MTATQACFGQGAEPLPETSDKVLEAASQSSLEAGVAEADQPSPTPDADPSADIPDLSAQYPGAPLPSDNAARVALVEALKLSLVPHGDPRFTVIAKLICDIFQTPVGGVSLLDDRRAMLPAFEGLDAPEVPFKDTFCQWTLVPAKPTVVVVADALLDARFRDHPVVKTGIRFYAGAPLVASNGQRLGTLCLLDTHPRHLDVESCSLLCNFAELVVRQLEKPAIVKDPASRRTAYSFDNQACALSRRMGTFDEAVVFFDATLPGWPVLYSNTELLDHTGLPEAPRHVWDAFELPSAAPAGVMSSVRNLISRQQKFDVIAIIPGDARQRHFELRCSPGGSDAFKNHPTITIPTVPLQGRGSEPSDDAALDPSGAQSIDASSPRDAGAPPAPSSVDVDRANVFRNESLSERAGPDGIDTSRFYFARLHLIADGHVSKSRLTAPVKQAAVSQKLEQRAADARRRSLDGVRPARFDAAPADTEILAAPSSLMNPLPSISAAAAVADHLTAPGTTPPPARPTTPPAPPGMVPAVKDLTAGLAAGPAAAAEWKLESLDEVELGPLLGRGSYGRVYRGMCKGRRVAVKVIDTIPSTRAGKELADRLHEEGELTARLRHPYIVQTLGYGTWGCPELSDSSDSPREMGSGSSGVRSSPSWDDELYDDWDLEPKAAQRSTESWVVMEYCNKGSVEQAVERGLFRQRRSIVDGPPNLAAILPTALEIASAMAYLHSQDVIHGDLSSSNILLKHVSQNRRGFVAKVGDFGLSRFASRTGTQINTQTQGTLTHCAPERFTEGLLVKAADVYAFGVLLWEMYCGERAWAGVRAAQVISLAIKDHGYLDMPGTCPQALKELTAACLSLDPAKRPTFEEAVLQLKACAASYRAQAQPAPAAA